MTTVRDGDTVDVRLPEGSVGVEPSALAMGPPGLRGQRGERGDPGGTTTVVYAFGAERTPDALPPDGLIPADWDGEGRPLADLQMAVGQSAKYLPDDYLWTFVGPVAVPGSWIEQGPMAGPPGDAGPVGPRGPEGPRGERGDQGPRGEIGLKGDQGDTGPQGARGLDGAAGPAGATGVPGPQGPPGADGLDGVPGEDGEQGEQGERGERGEDGLDGEPGLAGAPSFITGMLVAKTGSELATAAPTGLIPAHFDGVNRPPADHQMSPGEAWLASVAADPLRGQAIVYVGQLITSAPWIPMTVTGPQGDQGATGAQGPAGATGAAGADGSVWLWSVEDPPAPAMGKVGDFALVMLPGNPDTPSHGNTYQKIADVIWSPMGNIRGPRGLVGPEGPQGPMGPGVPPQDFLDLIQRVDRLEKIDAQSLSSDRILADDDNAVIQSVPLTVGDHIGQATITLELDRGTDVNPTNRVVTAWIEGAGPVVLTGHRAGQAYLHQALPVATLTLGPAKAVVSGPGNIVLYVRSERPVNEPGPMTGRVIVKATTSQGGNRAGATGVLAR